jgi:hypothetical protein
MIPATRALGRRCSGEIAGEVSSPGTSRFVQHVLDLDLDAFIYGTAYSCGRDQPRLNPGEYPPWDSKKLDEFLSNQCLLDGPLPGLAVDHHAEVFYAWREAIEAGILKEKFEVTHVDAHSDLAYFDTGRRYLRHEVLSQPIEARRYPKEGDEALYDGNYLAFAVANRWISSIEYVIGGRSEWECFDDEPPYEWQPGDLTFEDFEGSSPFSRVIRLSPAGSTPSAEPEPPVAFDWYRYQQFQAREPYDFIFLARSRPYTPESADELYERIKRRFIGDWLAARPT